MAESVDALAVVRRYGARATISKVLKGQANIAAVDRSPGGLMAAGLVAGSLPENRAAFQAELAQATPVSLAELRRVAKNIVQSLGRTNR